MNTFVRHFSLIILLIACVVLSANAVSYKADVFIPKDSITDNYIQFGSGGGFTGATKNYVLTKDGRLFSFTETISSRTSNTFIKKISRCKTRKIFTYAHKNGFMHTLYNDPGNMYSYITIVENGTNTIIWSKTNGTPETVIHLNQLLHSLL